MAGKIRVLRRKLWARLIDEHAHSCAYMLAGIAIGMIPLDGYLHHAWWVVYDIVCAGILVALGTWLELRAKFRREAWDRLHYPYRGVPYE